MPVFNGVLPFGTQIGRTDNFARSLAAYVQAELHVNDQLDIIGGVRITDDHKYGDFIFGTLAAPKNKPFDYKRTKPNYLIGVNYKPNDDILLYAKFSTAFVAGGSVAGVAFEPETAVSWEGGVKAEFLDKRLRTNLAVYTATYKNYQTAQGSTNFRFLFDPEVAPAISTFVLPQGTVKASGFEFEFTAAPAREPPSAVALPIRKRLSATSIHGLFRAMAAAMFRPCDLTGQAACGASTKRCRCSVNPTLASAWMASGKARST